MNPLESCKNDAQSSSVQTSGPIYVGSKNEYIVQPTYGAFKQKTSDPEVEKYPSIDGLNNDNWSVENYVGKNEHLMKSGQLGMCSDPYRTTYPMYYNVMGRHKHLRTPELVDAKDKKCIILNWLMTTTIVALRSVTDFIYLIHILLQFRLAYVALESRVVGAGDLVDDHKKIALSYFFGYFIIDFFVVLPIPQIIILVVLPESI